MAALDYGARGTSGGRKAPAARGCPGRLRPTGDKEHVEGVGVADAVVEGAADDGAAAPELCHLRACASRTVKNDDVMIIASSCTSAVLQY